MPLQRRTQPPKEEMSDDRNYGCFGLFLREKREEYHLAGHDVAKYCNVNRTTIVNLESGRYAPSMDLVFKLCEAFGYDDRIGDFLTDAGYTDRS